MHVLTTAGFARAAHSVLLQLLRVYFELWLMFEAVDVQGLNYTAGHKISTIGASQGDRRITIDEVRGSSEASDRA